MVIISHKGLSLQYLHSEEIGMGVIVQEYSGLRIIILSLNRGVAERLCYQEEHTPTHRQSQTHLEFRRRARHFFTVPMGLFSYPILVSFGGNLESPFHFALLVAEAKETCYLSCPGEGLIEGHDFI